MSDKSFLHGCNLNSHNCVNFYFYLCGNYYDADMWRVEAECLRISDSSSGVSDQQSGGSSPDHDTCVLEHVTSPYLVCPLDGT